MMGSGSIIERVRFIKTSSQVWTLDYPDSSSISNIAVTQSCDLPAPAPDGSGHDLRVSMWLLARRPVPSLRTLVHAQSTCSPDAM